MNALIHLIRVEVLHLHFRVGVVALEMLDVVPHVAEADGINRGHADGERSLAQSLAECDFQFCVLLEESLAALVIGLAEGGWL